MIPVGAIAASRRRAGGGGGGGVVSLELVGAKTALTNSGSDTVVSLTNLTGGFGDFPEEDDLVIVSFGACSSGDDAIGVVTAGYTEIAELWANSFDDSNLSVNYKVMGGTPDTTVTIGDGSDLAGVACISVWRGVDTSSPMDVAATTATGTSGSVDPPSITPSDPEAKIVATGVNCVDGLPTAFTSHGLDGFIQDVRYPAGANDNARTGMGWIDSSGSGAQNPGSWTNSGGQTWAAVTMALRKGSNPGAPPVFTGSPVISGTLNVGMTLTCTKGSATGQGVATYQWRRAGVDIVGATASTYLLDALDETEMIDCVVDLTSPYGTDQDTAAAVGPIGPFVGHRYWRLNIQGIISSGAYVAAAEVEMRASIGGADQCSGGTAIADSFFGGLPPSSAFDNNNGTHWANNGTGTAAWIGYDFGAGNQVAVAEVLYRVRGDGSWQQAPTSFDVEWSDNGSSWTLEWSETGISWSGAGQAQTFSA